jgi:acyl-CoA synthetase (NDP forming)
VAATNAYVNIPNYPPVEGILDRVASLPRHVLIDADRMARAAGTARAANMVILGATSLFLSLDPMQLEEALAEMFASKGDNVVKVNRRAFRVGRNAAAAYCDGVSRGVRSSGVRHWIETLPAERLMADDLALDAETFPELPEDALSGAEQRAFANVLEQTIESGRTRLFEHEIYTLIELVGAISPPRYVFIPRGCELNEDELAVFPGDRLALKIVSPDIVHKTEARGIAFVPKDLETARREMDRLVQAHGETAEVAGVLVVEYVERIQPAFGNELFVGVRATREFGPVIAAGLGGIDTEFLAAKMKPGIAVAKAVATDVSAEEFLDLFRATAGYELLSGKARGHQRIVSDGELLRCFRAFIAIARRFCTHHAQGGPYLTELEVNPFAFRQQRMVPLDGRACLGEVATRAADRPIRKVQHLVAPESIAILGASSTAMNPGRLILNNVKSSGFPIEDIYVIKDGADRLDGVQCIPSIAAAPRPIDLLVVAVRGDTLPQIIDEIGEAGNVHTAVLIPGGVGETEGTESIHSQVRDAIFRIRANHPQGPVFVGPNSLGIQSRIGRYDTFFILPSKLDPRWEAPPRRTALISQSGAFIISRMSNLESLDPAISMSIGNQMDLTVSDLLHVVGQREDIDTIGVYVEGFNDLDGLAFLRAVETLSGAGKTVIFYKAGRTAPGRSAAAGHTTAVAGDYDVCQAAATQAGAIVTDTFKEFEQLLELSTALHDKTVAGRRVGAISNAGFETVGMADSIRGARYEVSMATLSDDSAERLTAALKAFKLDALVNARNPLDLTPMASDDAYEAAIRVLLDSPDIDALVVSVVPLTHAMRTTVDEIAEDDSLAARLSGIFRMTDKPLIAVVDCGPLYDPYARLIRSQGVPCFRSCDQAIRSLGRYLCHRAPHPEGNRSTARTEGATAGNEVESHPAHVG